MKNKNKRERMSKWLSIFMLVQFVIFILAGAFRLFQYFNEEALKVKTVCNVDNISVSKSKLKTHKPVEKLSKELKYIATHTGPNSAVIIISNIC